MKGPTMYHQMDDDSIKLDTLSGDIRDVLLGHFRNQPKSWPEMAADDQRMVANAFTAAANELVRKVVQVFTSYEFPRAVVTLGEVKIKGEKGIEAKIGCPNIEHYRSILGQHVGQNIMVLMVDSETFMNSRAPVKIEDDQPDLPLGDGEGDPEGEWYSFRAWQEREAIDPETGEVLPVAGDQETATQTDTADAFPDADDSWVPETPPRAARAARG
jgi:hypothetical protein